MTFSLSLLSIGLLIMIGVPGALQAQAYSTSNPDEGWLDTFDLQNCNFSTTSGNKYFLLNPGYQLILEGEEDGEPIKLTITTLNETRLVNGTETRVVEERETENGELVEVSRNYFALCKQTGDIFYFGEITDIYEDGKIIDHEGSWEAGVHDAKPGLIFPGNPTVGMKYYQEIAPGIAQDRAEVVSISEKLQTQAGQFINVLKIRETTPLEPGMTEYKFFASDIGLVQDENLKLAQYSLPEIGEEPVDPEAIPKVELKPLVQTVNVRNQTIVQVDMNSSSLITEFQVDEPNKRVTFKANNAVQGEGGITEISIGKILEGPYAVTIDGKLITNITISKEETARDTILTISYGKNTHEIVISGTNIVPEFPISSIAVLAGLTGIVAAFVRRSSIFKQ